MDKNHQNRKKHFLWYQRTKDCVTIATLQRAVNSYDALTEKAKEHIESCSSCLDFMDSIRYATKDKQLHDRIIDAQNRLRKKDPDNSLLTLVTFDKELGPPIPDHSEDFFERYITVVDLLDPRSESKQRMFKALERYAADLENVAK